MAKTLDDLQHLLTRQGYTCELLLDAIVATRVATKTYKNPSGENALEIYVTFDRPNRCVAVESLRAFDLRATAHKEATLACMLTATGRTPLLRPALEPEGDIKIRIDCPCDSDGNGIRDERVLEAIVLLKGFVEAWHPQMTAAMKTGKFNANDVAHLNLSRMPSHRPNQPTDGAGDKSNGNPEAQPDAQPDAPSDAQSDPELAAEPDPEPTGPAIGSVMRAAAISMKPGGHVNRLKALAEFHKWLDEQGRGNGEQN
jgi:hypothetical protein